MADDKTDAWNRIPNELPDVTQSNVEETIDLEYIEAENNSEPAVDNQGAALQTPTVFHFCPYCNSPLSVNRMQPIYIYSTNPFPIHIIHSVMNQGSTCVELINSLDTSQRISILYNTTSLTIETSYVTLTPQNNQQQHGGTVSMTQQFNYLQFILNFGPAAVHNRPSPAYAYSPQPSNYSNASADGNNLASPTSTESYIVTPAPYVGAPSYITPLPLPLYFLLPLHMGLPLFPRMILSSSMTASSASNPVAVPPPVENIPRLLPMYMPNIGNSMNVNQLPLETINEEASIENEQSKYSYQYLQPNLQTRSTSRSGTSTNYGHFRSIAPTPSSNGQQMKYTNSRMGRTSYSFSSPLTNTASAHQSPRMYPARVAHPVNPSSFIQGPYNSRSNNTSSTNNFNLGGIRLPRKQDNRRNSRCGPRPMTTHRTLKVVPRGTVPDSTTHGDPQSSQGILHPQNIKIDVAVNPDDIHTSQQRDNAAPLNLSVIETSGPAVNEGASTSDGKSEKLMVFKNNEFDGSSDGTT